MHFQLEEATIQDIQNAFESGELTAKALVLLYLNRIANYDKEGLTINSVLEINPDALFIAEALDNERQNQGSRGPMHGIPVLLKDNINTGDALHTSAGSLALANSYAIQDAYIVEKLREAGAIILGKANMTEFANFMTDGMPSGYSSRGGQVLNPYNISTPTGGSSSGSAVAVACSFCTVAVGTETSGSILNPGNLSSTVGIKPTVGLISRSGILPLSYSQDTAGPMARTVTDAVLLLNALLGDDVNDSAMGANKGKRRMDYTTYLDKHGLNGARIGIPRDYYFEELTEEQLAIFNKAVESMRQQGAVIVESANIKTCREIIYSSVVFNEFKSALNMYLSRLGPHAPIHSLKEIIDFNHNHPIETLKYGQSTLIETEFTTTGKLTEPNYIRDKTRDLQTCQTDGIDATMKEFELDALLFPADFGATVTSRAGYPSIVVPAGYTAAGVPFGVTFSAMAYSEPTLIKLAYSLEQHTQIRKAPSLKSFL
ncbi:amidase [Paenibacillus psychroresistens]|uniref:Amidase n=1 Tax=Paenibacillus psychroresistens TaxID=1778678 RepID=A0A6B8RMM7_9BACL|nr:amidase family protein [Paenibacillus psychroresistens]QGQ97289.1 amidase [Paenibacillus psychroresistens]